MYELRERYFFFFYVSYTALRRCIIVNFNGIVCSRDAQFLGINCVVSFVSFPEEALAGLIIDCANCVIRFISVDALIFHRFVFDERTLSIGD